MLGWPDHRQGYQNRISTFISGDVLFDLLVLLEKQRSCQTHKHTHREFSAIVFWCAANSWFSYVQPSYNLPFFPFSYTRFYKACFRFVIMLLMMMMMMVMMMMLSPTFLHLIILRGISWYGWDGTHTQYGNGLKASHSLALLKEVFNFKWNNCPKPLNCQLWLKTSWDLERPILN